MTTLMKFYSAGCAPCEHLARYLKNPAFTNITIDPVDYEFHKDVFKEYNVRSVPTCILLDETGEELGRVTGFKPDALLDLIKLAGS